MTTTPTPVPPAAPVYPFADDPTTGATQHKYLVSHLAAILDDFTISRLTPLVEDHFSCLEVAAGASRVAEWLAEHTAETIATDIDPWHVSDHHPRLRVIRHDLDSDPLEPGRHNLIHCRLLLGHKRNREQLLAKLATALAPRGVLVIEEFQPAWDWCVLDAPDMAEAQRLFGAYHLALTSYLRASGNDPGWGRRVLSVMRQIGLAEVKAVLHADSYDGGQPGCLLPHTAAAQLRPHLEAHGMTGADIDAFRALLMDQRLTIHPNLVVSTSGHRP